MGEVQDRLVAIGRAGEIVARLRANDWEIRPVDSVYQACEDGADEIERLMGRIMELEGEIEALKKRLVLKTDGRQQIPHWY